MKVAELNDLGARIRDAILEQHPQWARYVDVLERGDLEIAVPAPKGSRAGHLVVFTDLGQHVWVRYARPRMCYPAGSEAELLAVVDALLADDAFFVVIMQGDEWVETGLYRPGQEPTLAEGQVANAVSWSGRHDRLFMQHKV